MDLFADAIMRLTEGREVALEIERDDGDRDTEDISWYLAPYRTFATIEKQALRFARGRALDVGCGAGRHALYLQKKGLEVTGLDRSEKLVRLARARGVVDARVANACGRLAFRRGQFDTILLFGNNLGICGSVSAARRMLRELHRVTSAEGRVLATSRMPAMARDSDLDYIRRNIERGRAPGALRLRLILEGRRGPWFELLLLSPTELMQLASTAGWRVTRVFPWNEFADGYAVVMEKLSPSATGA